MPVPILTFLTQFSESILYNCQIWPSGTKLSCNKRLNAVSSQILIRRFPFLLVCRCCSEAFFGRWSVFHCLATFSTWFIGSALNKSSGICKCKALTLVCPHTAPSWNPDQPGCPAESWSCGRWTGTAHYFSCCPADATARWAGSAEPRRRPWFCETSGPLALQAGATFDSPDRISSHPAWGRQTF